MRLIPASRFATSIQIGIVFRRASPGRCREASCEKPPDKRGSIEFGARGQRGRLAKIWLDVKSCIDAEWIVWVIWSISVTAGSKGMLTMRNIRIQPVSLAVVLGLGLKVGGLLAADQVKPASALETPGIVIRPANFDPGDELAYTRLRGKVDAGMSPDGNVWNKPASDDLRAAGSGTPAPAPASQGESAPVSAASGSSFPRMTYEEAYSQISFRRSEYEANPSYRHDSAMELAFGTLRPMTIIRTTPSYFSRYPDLFRHKYPVYPYSYSGGGTSSTNMFWNTSLIAY
jgi:hypothetical protein